MKENGVAIIGVGYVGTVIASALANKGLPVIGIDIDKDNVKKLNQGNTSIYEPGIKEALKLAKIEGDFYATSDISEISKVKTIIVTVGTPLSENFDADLTQLDEVAQGISKHISKDTLICLKSTVIPGTTEKFANSVIKNSGFVLGKDFFISFSPERLAEGTALKELQTYPIVVGSDNPESVDRCSDFWHESLGLETIRVSSYVSAELTKLADNLWVDVNVCLANMIASLTYELGADSTEVIRAANSLPKGKGKVNILDSSIGVGGSCLTKDPLFVAKLLQERKLDSSLINSARDFNNSMPKNYVVKILEWGKKNKIKKLNVSLIGLSFKSDTNDLRFTPMKDVYDLLKNKVNLKLYDPYVTKEAFERLVGERINFCSLENCFLETDVVVFGCSHSAISFSAIKKLIPLMKDKKLIVDGRHGYEELRDLLGKKDYLYI